MFKRQQLINESQQTSRHDLTRTPGDSASSVDESVAMEIDVKLFYLLLEVIAGRSSDNLLVRITLKKLARFATDVLSYVQPTVLA